MATVQRVDATHARWTFTAPLESIQDDTSFEINGAASLSTVWVTGSTQVLVAYAGPIVVAQAWNLATDTVEFPGGVPCATQTGRVL